MTVVDNLTKTIYSADRKLWVGMKEDDVYENKEKYELFASADKNENNVIDEWEIRRYDGPLVSAGEFEFYPGLKIDEVNDKKFKLAFSDLDLNSDKELSKEELLAYQKYCDEKKNHKKVILENKNIEETNDAYKRFAGFIGGAALGISGFVGGIVASNAAEKAIYNKYIPVLKDDFGRRLSINAIKNSNKYSWDTLMQKAPSFLRFTASDKFITAAALVGAALGIFAGVKIANHFKKEQIPTDGFKESELDEQYKHVYCS